MATCGQFALLCLGLHVLLCQAEVADTNPIEKVMSLLAGLESKITAEGAAEDKAYKEFMEWCDDTTTEVGFEIKTATAQKQELQAAIGKSASDIEVATTGIDEIAESISTSENDLKAATGIREKEHADSSPQSRNWWTRLTPLTRPLSFLRRRWPRTLR